ncbi:MAG TPA: leucyl/phenylalanyl-tRNA--protein transferase [Bacteroidales bacterium]|nr:leucyl/phenylalanyl-tRNA--protein transferase [Bacteroidales bacterium]
MPHFLTSELYFPDVEKADASGLLAIGGDLSVKRLLLAYSSGLFPWYEGGYPILWWSPDPRMVLFPDRIKISKSLQQRIKKQDFEIRVDTSFSQVIRLCATSGGRFKVGTWITPEMVEAYIKLHREGYAHSFETWHKGKLVGGLYGISLGRAFFGESMFYLEPDASKIALVYLAGLMRELKFEFIDVQQETQHLKSMGATLLSRRVFMILLKKALDHETITGKWTKFGDQNNSLKKISDEFVSRRIYG